MRDKNYLSRAESPLNKGVSEDDGRDGDNLLENLLGEHGQIDAPVAPDVTTVGLYILVLVALAVPIVAQVDG